MTVRCSLALGSIILGGALAYALPGHADPPGAPAVVTVHQTVTRTVLARSHHHSAAFWYMRNGQHRRALNHASLSLRRANQTIRRETLEARRAQADYRDDYGIAGNPFLCVHDGEGSWTDPGAPYYGGLQMDETFMRAYGGPFYRAWGTADHWPAYIQIAVAEAARLSGRGYGPWPNTARACGLL